MFAYRDLLDQSLRSLLDAIAAALRLLGYARESGARIGAA